MSRENCGYEIVDSISIEHIEIVLGKNANDNYVTWSCRNGTDYNHGNYFNDVLSAKKDLCERALQKIKFQESLRVKQQNREKNKEVTR